MANAAIPAPTTSDMSLVPRKVVARVLLAGLDDSTVAVFRDCFKQFSIQTVSTNGDTEHRLKKEKFEACVVQLHRPDAESILNAARTSSSNFRIVIYGISHDTQEAMRFSKYGINAVIDLPVERQTVLRVVRATHLLVVHELRRYVRLPVVTTVKVEYAQGTFRANSAEISAGGMSMHSDVRLAKEEPVEVKFTLPNNPKPTVVRANVCWKHDAANMFGIRFDLTDERRLDVKRWIDTFLEI